MLGQLMNEKKLSCKVIFQIEDEIKKSQGDFESVFLTLKEEFNKDELSEIYSKLLGEIKSPNFLRLLIREIDKLRHPDNLSDLIDFILDCDAKDFPDSAEYINLKVLCVKAISNYKDIKAVTPLLYCLNNKNENYKFRLAAAEALGKIGDKNAVESLIDVVSDENEKSVYVRESAALALGMIGDARALDAFVRILEAKKSFLDKFTFLKERIIEALNKIDFSGNKRAIAVLKEALSDESPQVRINAIESLMNSSVEEASDLIWKMLYDEDDEVRKNAVIALYNMEGKDALIRIISDDTLDVSCKEEAQEVLLDVQEDEDDE